MGGTLTLMRPPRKICSPSWQRIIATLRNFVARRSSIARKSYISKRSNLGWKSYVSRRINLSKRNSIDRKSNVSRRSSVDRKSSISRRNSVDRKSSVCKRNSIDRKSSVGRKNSIDRKSYISRSNVGRRRINEHTKLFGPRKPGELKRGVPERRNSFGRNVKLAHGISIGPLAIKPRPPWKQCMVLSVSTQP
jgi:hypothetical protein